MAEELNRRSFLKTAALAAGPAVISARGANDKINIGWIGVGTRGNAALDWLHTAAPERRPDHRHLRHLPGLHRPRARTACRPSGATRPATYADYHELLADKSIDAVFIMTPEHLHHDMAIAALKAGKHVYVEKPLAHTIEEGFDIVSAWKSQSKRKIVPGGHPEPQFVALQEGQGTGAAGHDRRRALRARLLVSQLAPDEPAWRYVIPPDATPQNTDWNRFLGPAPKRPWDPHRYFQWRLYWDYSGGISTDLLVHQTDIVNFMLDKTVPKYLHGLRRHLPLDGTTTATCPIPQRHLRIRRQFPDQLQLLSSATITTATASSCAATKAPSK